MDSVGHELGRGSPGLFRVSQVTDRWWLEHLKVLPEPFHVQGLVGLPHSMAAQGASLSTPYGRSFDNLASKVMQCHFCCSPLVAQ